jgi:hypothetical protein
MSRDEVIRHLRYELCYNTQFDDKDKRSSERGNKIIGGY